MHRIHMHMSDVYSKYTLINWSWQSILNMDCHDQFIKLSFLIMKADD